MAEFTSRVVVKGLIANLKANMPALKQAYDDWPNPNQKLEFPSCSIFSGPMAFTPVMPYVTSKGAKITTGADTDKYPVRRVMGRWDFKLTIDLWADSKPSRATIENQLITAFNLNPDVAGIRIQLTDYYNEWVSFIIDRFSYPDSQEGSQRSEWRSKIEVLGTCRQVHEKNEFLIGTIENTLATPAEIVNTDEDSVTTII